MESLIQGIVFWSDLCIYMQTIVPSDWSSVQ